MKRKRGKGDKRREIKIHENGFTKRKGKREQEQTHKHR